MGTLIERSEIGVTVKDGAATLTGIVNSYAKKLEAEYAAKTVAGVTASSIVFSLNY
jgi:osmotically-inducible protein OsmY